MTVAVSQTWSEANQRYLAVALAGLKRALQEPGTGIQEPAWLLSEPHALEAITRTFGLSPFERAVLLLAAAIELDSSFISLLAKAQGDPLKPYPTFSLALASLPDPHWSALTPDAPLRRWRLIELAAGPGLTQSPLRVDERVLHYLTGVDHVDERLVGMVEPVQPDELTSSQQALSNRLAASWSKVEGPLPVAQLCGGDDSGRQAVAARACAALGLGLFSLSALTLPTAPAELEALRRLWEREAALSGSALLLECGEETHDAVREAAIALFVGRLRSPLILGTPMRQSFSHRSTLILEVQPPTAAEQRALWRSSLGEVAAQLDGQVDQLATQFRLDASAIRSVCAEALARGSERDAPHALADQLWDACRGQSSPRLDELAQRIEPAATWDDLVLPELACGILREIAMHVRHRGTVYETWGFAAKSARGLGISALFVGPSGTGKAMAAEVLANELRLDLHRIDLSQVVSKYIGETEKNLRHVFDAAEGSGAILLFDEADALFGKRSEVRDSHDRYANIEIGYLLQQMEAYRGLAILTTNMKEALDTAFLRRIRFVVQFPFPDAAHRAEIWKRIFPRQTPIEGLDVNKLARLNVAGGNIRNIALNATFLAAGDGGLVRMTHLLQAARTEYAKLEKPLTSSEIGGWVEA